MIASFGIDEAVVHAEGDVASLGELPCRVLHMRAAARPHPTAVDEDHGGPSVRMRERPVDIEQQRFAGDGAVDHAAIHFDMVLVRADNPSPREDR